MLKSFAYRLTIEALTGKVFIMETKAKVKRLSHKAASSMFISQSSALRNRTTNERESIPSASKPSKNRTNVNLARSGRQPDFILGSEADGVVVVEVKRLSDPTNRDAINRTLKSLSSDKAKALEFLQSIGIASSTGTLTKRFGG